MVHALDLRVAVQEVDDLKRVLDVALDAQRERFQALQQDKRVEGGQRCTLVAQERGARLGYIGGLACGFSEHDAVVARVRLRDAGELVGVASPVELARIDDHAAHRRAVAADELRGGRDHHVGPVLDRAQQVGRREGVVHDERKVVLVRDGGPALDVEHVGVGVAECFRVEELGVVLDGGFDGVKVGGVHERGGKPLLGKGVLEQIERAAVKVGGGDDVVADRGDVLHRDGDGGRSGGDAERSDAALKRGDALFKDGNGGVGQAGIDVARLGEAEAPGCGRGVLEHEGRRQVDRHGARIGGGVGVFLAGVDLQGLERVGVLFF